MTQALTHADIPVAVLIDDDTLLLYGSTDRAAPTEGAVTLEADERAGRFAALPLGDDGGTGPVSFIACVQVEGLARLRPTRLEVAGADGSRLLIQRLTNVRTNPGLFLGVLREEQAGALDAALDFLVSRLAPAGTEPSERVARLLSSLLEEAARPDGYAEIFGRFRGQGLLIQGWSSSLGAGARVLVLDGDRFGVHAAATAAFARPDLPAGAQGALAVLPQADMDPACIRRLHHRTPQGWRRLEVFQNRTTLPDGDALGHLRDMLGVLSGDPAVIRALGRFAASQYEGRETVSALEAPVRAAIDAAHRVAGAGVFLTG